MKDYSHLRPDEFGQLCSVLGELYTKVDPGEVMVVGAAARDLIHRDLGFEFALRSTTDIDVAVVLAEKQAYRELTSAYSSVGNSGIRFRIANYPVDIVPFGGLEDPEGTAVPNSDGHEVNVFGFSEVHAKADEYTLPGGLVAKLPSPAGYCATKIKAWVDRSDYELKDAADMSYICYWYQRSAVIEDVLYGAGAHLLQAAQYDLECASMYLLGSEIRSILGPALSGELRELWDSESRGKMARSEIRDTTLGSGDYHDPEYRRRNYDAIHSYL